MKVKIVKRKKTVTVEPVGTVVGIKPFEAKRIYCLWCFTQKTSHTSRCSRCNCYGSTTKPMSAFRAVYIEPVR